MNEQSTPGTLFVRDEGPADAPAVLFLHSLFFTGDMFDDLLAEFSGPVRAIRPDHRGQGRSRLAGGRPSIQVLAEDAAAHVDARIGGPVHVVGSSMGGYVAAELAASRPDLITTCTLICCTSQAETRMEMFMRLVDDLRLGMSPELVDRLEFIMFGDSFAERDADDSCRSRWRAQFAGLDPSIADAAEAVFTRPSMIDAIERLTVPLLLIAGEEDHAKRPSDMFAIRELVPDSRVEVIPDAGHTPAIETPKAVAAALEPWWQASKHVHAAQQTQGA